LRLGPEGGFLEHRLANGGLETIGPDEDVACCGGPVLEAQLDRGARALGVTFEALGWNGAAMGGRVVQQDLMKLGAMKPH
jgi:hypothetical protein